MNGKQFKSLIVLLGLVFFSPALLAADAEVTKEISKSGTEWKSQVGASAIFNSGNSSNQTFGGNGHVSAKWEKNKLAGKADGAYGRARDNDTGVTSVNTKNWQIGARYDRFINDPMSLFIGQKVSADELAGFNFVYTGLFGFAHEIYKTDPHFFKYEAGFDYSREWRVLAAEENIYSARIYWQYKYKISEAASFSQDFESLFNVEDLDDTRINTLSALTVKMTTKLALQASFKLRYDNLPVPGNKKTDTTTQFGLVLDIL